MNNNSIEVRPGLDVEHLRQLVRLRRASGWLGILAFVGLLALRGMDRMDPDLFKAAVPERHASVTRPSGHAKAAFATHHAHKVG